MFHPRHPRHNSPRLSTARREFAPGDGFGRREPLFRVRSAREGASSARMVDAREDSRDDAPLRHSDDQISSVATDATERPARDVGFKRAFVTCVVVTLAGGGLAFTGVSADAGRLNEDETLKAYASCHAEDGSATRRRSLLASGDVPDDAEVRASLSDARPYVIAAVLGAVALGTCALALFRRHPRATTWGMIYVKIASLATLSVMLFSQGSILGGVLFALFAGFFAYWMRATRDRVELVAKLLGAASTALRDNPHLITTSVFASIGVALAAVAFLSCVYAAFMNGSIAPANFTRHDAGACYGGVDGTERVACCVWETDGWVPAYVFFALMVALWTAMLAAEMRTFIIGGSISRWYFAPAGTTRFVGTTREFVSHALGPSFGSLAFGGLVLTGVTILRNMNERLRRESRGAAAVLACVFTALMDCLAEVIEQVTKFATIQCAITGDAFCDAGREVTRLLKDNFLPAVRVWWLPEMILNTAALIVALFYAFIVGTTVAVAKRDEGEAGESVATLVAIIAGVATLFVLGFLFSVLLTCVDACFLCYARDKDENVISKPDLVAIYDEVTEKTREPDVAAMASAAPARPTATPRTTPPGVVFQQPNAPMMYGRPDSV